MFYDAIEEIEEDIQNAVDPNTICDFDYNIVATFNSLTDVNRFCNSYTHANNYNGLMIGNRIQINDGTYNKLWYIAGFDLEHNRQASDGTTYDNGYGICLVPASGLLDDKWANSSSTPTSYIDSSIHNSILPVISSNLQNILGDHLINRNVLLNSAVTTNGYVSSYTWTTAYCTLMDQYQIDPIGINYGSGEGEATYFIPLFRFIPNTTFLQDSGTHAHVWLRTPSGRTLITQYGYYEYNVEIIGWNNNNLTTTIGNICNVRPLIYIR